MEIKITINGEAKTFSCLPGETLFSLLRREGYHSVRFGSKTGETGASAVLVDGILVSTVIMLAAQADGHSLETIEGLSQGIQLHPIQAAFIRTGAIQSGYATPATILAAKALLEANPNPTEAEVRDALSGILDRETGYVKPVQAVLEAASVLRGENPTTIEPNVLTPIILPGDDLYELFRAHPLKRGTGTGPHRIFRKGV
jgi:putative selenate reductase molybdopterin-binding subunit